MARKFYLDTLGLEVETVDDGMGTLFCDSGGTPLLVYRSEHAGTNRATAATWVVDEDVAELVRGLEARGVVFEPYDLPDTRREGSVHVSCDIRIAWFKDPDGISCRS